MKTENKNKVSITDARNVNNQVKQLNKTLGGCISNILRLEAKGLKTEEAQIISFLVKAKKDAKIYKLLSDKVKPHYKTGNYNNYSVIVAVKGLL
jgi:hypothetical protein